MTGANEENGTHLYLKYIKNKWVWSRNIIITLSNCYGYTCCKQSILLDNNGDILELYKDKSESSMLLTNIII